MGVANLLNNITKLVFEGRPDIAVIPCNLFCSIGLREHLGKHLFGWHDAGVTQIRLTVESVVGVAVIEAIVTKAVVATDCCCNQDC